MEGKRRIKVKVLLGLKSSNKEILVKGWVRTKRGSKNAVFIAVNDGSTIHNIQVVVRPERFSEELLKRITTGASIQVTGLWVASPGRGQLKELRAKTLTVLGDANPDTYPLQPKRHSLEFLREIAHLRPRTNTIGAITGPNGGYRLSKSSSDISIADIVQCIEGKIDSTRCGGTSNCIAGQECLSHSLWTDLNAEMELFLSKRSLEDVLKSRKVKFSSHKSALETKNMIVIG